MCGGVRVEWEGHEGVVYGHLRVRQWREKMKHSRTWVLGTHTAIYIYMYIHDSGYYMVCVTSCTVSLHRPHSRDEAPMCLYMHAFMCTCTCCIYMCSPISI